LIGIGLGLIGVAVLVVAVIALRSPNGHGTSADRATTRQPSTPTPPRTHRSTATSAPSKTVTGTTHARAAPATHSSSAAAVKMPLVVLNNTRVPGLAALARSRFEAGGWTVTSTGNLVNNIVSTCAYYDPGLADAQAAAQALRAQFPAIKRVVVKFDGLPAGPIVVVLTSDYS
jgi:hypothetical protein